MQYDYVQEKLAFTDYFCCWAMPDGDCTNFSPKISIMKFYSLIFMLALLASCQSDEKLSNDFAGRYQVTLHLPEAKKDMMDAKKEVETEMAKAQEEIDKGMDEAKKEIESELGKENDFGDAMGNFAEGMGNLAKGLAKLGEGLGKMGIDLGEGIVDGLKFKAEFKPDGTVYFGKRSKLQIGNGVNWEIKDGKFYLWDEGEAKKEFIMEKTGEGIWELKSADVVFHLEKNMKE